MKLFNHILFCLISISINSQEVNLSDKETVQLKMTQIDEALISKDTSTLTKILHKDLTLGHSNGWLETKPDLLQTLINEGVIYTTIEMMGEPKVYSSSENLITTRRSISVSGVVNETSFDVKLNVLEVWISESNEWQLLARQSINRKD